MSNYGDQFCKCPECGGTAACEAVDVGVGVYLHGPYVCACGWDSETSPAPTLTMEERPFIPGEAYDD